MVSLTCFNRRFTPGWRMLVLTFLIAGLFFRLGFWQLARAAEKKRMLATQARLAQQVPVNWKPGLKNPEQYQPLKVEGHYLPALLFLDNQHYQHQFGYHVFSPLLLSSNEIILVDRGWVIGDVSRKTLPLIATPAHNLHLTGYTYYPSKRNWVLGQVYEKKEGNIAIIERIDTKMLGQFLHKSVYPFIIRLGKGESDGFVREWPIVAMSPERHYAYALQWFAMASLILILFIVLNLKKTYEPV
ncbi:SURF1 family protein [Legionella fairfieldensis]|uniref:SURF1 family protein n=1 Tax=Legionella fairfieldensis TaxID=45064 RepID=UPI00048FED86|nr:SURF1 family protein [Legionella fairfieldensis]